MSRQRRRGLISGYLHSDDCEKMKASEVISQEIELRLLC